MNTSEDQRLAKAVASVKTGDHAKAIAICRQILAEDPSRHPAYSVLGVVCFRNKRYRQAAGFFHKAVKLDANNTVYWTFLCISLRESGDLKNAIIAAKNSVQTCPDAPAPYMVLGKTCYMARHIDYAAAAFKRAFQLKPSANAGYALGCMLRLLSRLRDAALCFAKCIELAPDHLNAHMALSSCLLVLGDFTATKAICMRALERGMQRAEIYSDLGAAEMGIFNFIAAREAYKQALKIDPGYKTAISNMANLVAHLCDWPAAKSYQEAAARLTLEAARGGGKFCMMPFTALTMDLDPATQLQITEHYVRSRTRPELLANPPSAPISPKRDHITIAYLSADFRDHPVMHLARNLFKHHDRERFRICAYSCGTNDESEYRKHVEATCDAFVDIRVMDTDQVVNRIKADQIDILVDMTGHTLMNRADVLAHRPAPVQMHFLGYPGTMAAPYMDYFISDHVLTPPGSEACFTEKLIYMPDTYQVSDDEQSPEDLPVSRADEGLPEDGFVFCSLNSSYKIEPRIFDCWMQILKRTPGSVLWLLTHLPIVAERLRTAANERGVDAERLIFANRVSKPKHLARHVLADLFLDTYIVCGHTTANDALQMGIPIIACPRPNFISRVSATLLHAHGLDELICPSLEAYVELAIDLHADRDRLSRYRVHLEQTRETVPARDTARFARHLELAYEKAIQLNRAGQPPEPIDVAELKTKVKE